MATKIVAPVLEEGADPETGRDRNSSQPRPVPSDQPIGLLAVLEKRLAGVEAERAAYEAAGKKERVKACDAEIKRLAADIKAASKETTDGEGPDEFTGDEP